MAAGPSSEVHPSSSTVAETGNEAGPLPSKIGEIGYQQGEGAQSEMTEIGLEDDGPRSTHPAERSPGTSSPPTIITTPPAAESSNMSTHSKRSIFSFLHSKKSNMAGIHYATIFRMIVILLVIGGSSAAWAVLITNIDKLFPPTISSDPAPASPPSGSPVIGGASNGGGFSSSIFIHVAFTTGILFQLLFLERSIFRARAERYNHLHPSSGAATTASAVMGLAPWNRPPLPTYAAALAGRGTGDVEDNIIAQPPPPAYGNTRGSTLLLSNFLRNSLRSVRSRASEMAESRSRPISYGDSEERTDAERARAVEEALARLEEGSARR